MPLQIQCWEVSNRLQVYARVNMASVPFMKDNL